MMLRHYVVHSFVGAIFLLMSVDRLSATEVVNAPGPSGMLAGVLERASGPAAPVVLIIPGSGAVDRDGDGPDDLRASSYRLLAAGLARHGITTLRVDKRGMFGSAAAIPDPNQVTISDYAVDVSRWALILRERIGASCVWVLGHSEGGLVALIAAQHEADICGLVLIATPGRRVGDVLRSQLRANPANALILPEALSALASLEAGHHVDAAGLNPALLSLFPPAVQGFLISELAVDPGKLIAGLRMPVLILQGERDLQVQPADAQHLADSNPRAALRLLPDVNHILKSVRSDNFEDNLATYSDPDLPLAPGVAEQIATFILNNGPTQHRGLKMPTGLGTGNHGDQDKGHQQR